MDLVLQDMKYSMKSILQNLILSLTPKSSFIVVQGYADNDLLSSEYLLLSVL